MSRFPAMQESSSPPASGLPVTASSPSLPPVDDEKPAGKVWNGYACPGCRSVFRVAADFHGGDVICPSCHETLRLPKAPEEKPPPPVTPVAMPSKPTKPPRAIEAAAMQAPAYQEAEESTWQGMLSSGKGRIKIALALLVPLAVVVAVLWFEPWKKTGASGIASGDVPPVPAEISSPAKPAPPPPPVAVNEMPMAERRLPPTPDKPEPTVVSPEPPPALPEPVAETAEATPSAPPAQLAESTEDPEPVIGPPPAPVLEEEELVEAVPVDFNPVPAPIAQADVTPSQVTDPASTPAPEETAEQTTELIHTVVSGDTLSKISRTYQIDISEIKNANGIRNDVIMLGQKLKIPGGIAPSQVVAQPAAPPLGETPAPAASPRFHTVVRGDTLVGIARNYRVEARAIMQANGMKNDVVHLGRKLTIPSARP